MAAEERRWPCFAWVRIELCMVGEAHGTDSCPRSLVRRSIRLPDPGSYAESPMAQTLASVPWALVGLANTAWAWISRQAESLPFLQRRMPRTRASYGGYRGLAQDEDAAVSRRDAEDERDGRSD